MKAKIIRASVNFIIKWRVYFGGELLATFEKQSDAKRYAKFIDEQK